MVVHVWLVDVFAEYSLQFQACAVAALTQHVPDLSVTSPLPF